MDDSPLDLIEINNFKRKPGKGHMKNQRKLESITGKNKIVCY